MSGNIIRLLSNRGLLITSSLSILILCVFFGKALFHANSVYFGTAGDGMQIYYTSLYHVLHDDSYLFQACMNYPYGENVFFTACQPLLTGILKLFGLGSITIGVTNLIMLFSIVLSAVFLYLIFEELEIHYLYAALSAIAIAFLSPQMMRLFAHYVLTYQFAIPAFFYGLLKFSKNPTYKKSLIISLLTFFMATTHLYFFGFFALLSVFYWAVLFMLQKEKFKNVLFCIKHFSIQIILPYVLLQLIIYSVNNVNDRTSYPWGILIYKTNWTGVFYPFGRYYEFIPKLLGIIPQEVNIDEGYEFVGLLATVAFIFIVLKFAYNILLLRIRNVFVLTGNLVLDIFIWCSIPALLYSFGYPFVFDHEDWLNKIGILRQMRGIARFSWLFFYAMNIAGVYIIFLVSQKIKTKWLKHSILILMVIFLSADGYYSIGSYNRALSRRIVELNDRKNDYWRNKIFKTFDFEKYQAIMSLPFFHVGSENVGVEPKGKILIYSYIFSLKTGLPLICNTSSRASISQTFNSLALHWEKTTYPLQIVKDFKNRKHILVIADPGNMSFAEADLLKYAKFESKYIKGLELYTLSIDSLEKLPKATLVNAMAIAENCKNEFENNSSSDSIKRYVSKNFDELSSSSAKCGKGSFITVMNKYNDLYFDTLPNPLIGTNYSISFWMNNIKKDRYPRTTLAIEVVNKDGKYIDGYYTAIKEKIKCVQGNWALIETEIALRESSDKIKATVFNFDLTSKDTLEIDELLIRPISINVCQKNANFINVNNRFYYY